MPGISQRFVGFLKARKGSVVPGFPTFDRRASSWTANVVAAAKYGHSGFTTILECPSFKRGDQVLEGSLLLGHADGRAALYRRRAPQGKTRFVFSRAINKHPYSVLCSAVTAQNPLLGPLLATGHSRGEVWLHRVAEAQTFHMVRTGDSAITNVAFLHPPDMPQTAPDGTLTLPLLVFTSSRGYVTLWDPNSSRVLSNMRPNSRTLRGLVVLGPLTFATCGSDGALRVWSAVKDRERGYILRAESEVLDAHGDASNHEVEGNKSSPTKSSSDAALSSLAVLPLGHTLSPELGIWSRKARASLRAQNSAPVLSEPFHVLATVGKTDGLVRLWRYKRSHNNEEAARQPIDSSAAGSTPACAPLPQLLPRAAGIPSTPSLLAFSSAKKLDAPGSRGLALGRISYELLATFSVEHLGPGASTWAAHVVAERFLVIATAGSGDLVAVDVLKSIRARRKFEERKPSVPKGVPFPAVCELLQGHAGSVYGITPLSGGDTATFASASADGTVRKWELQRDPPAQHPEV